MLRKAKKLGAVLMALTMIFVLAISAGAAYFNTPKAIDVDGTVVGTATAESVTASLELVKDKARSINFYVTGDALEPEFWNNSNAYVEVDITLNTDAVNPVTAVLPGFTSTWGWVNPTSWNGQLSYGKTVTLREPLSTYYKGGFKDDGPLLVRVQIYNESADAEAVEVTVSNIRIVGLDDAPVATTTTTEATTTTAAPEESTPVESTPDDTDAPVEDDEPVDVPATDEAGEPADDEPEKTTPASTSTTVKPEESTAATTTKATTTAATTKPVSSDDSGEAGIAGPVVIIVIVVLVIAGGVVGVIIYRKKKFY